MRKRSIGMSFAMVALVLGGLSAVGSATGIGTAHACVTASGTAQVDCDGIQGGELSGNTNGAVDGHGSTDGQGVEDYDGTHGEFCSAGPGEVPRC
jgi:hypothetical protein